MPTGAVTHLSCIIALLLWRPHPHQLAVFFMFSGLWGVADAVWQTQNNGESPLGGPYLGQRGGHVVGGGPAIPGPPGEVTHQAASLEQEASRGAKGAPGAYVGLSVYSDPEHKRRKSAAGTTFFPKNGGPLVAFCLKSFPEQWPGPRARCWNHGAGGAF